MDWDAAWSQLERAFAVVKEAVRDIDPTVACRSDRGSNEAFPFWGYLSALRSAEDDEVFVISIDCWQDANDIRCTSDLSRGSGHVLADGPAVKIAPHDAAANSAVMEWTAKVVEFIRAQTSTILQKVRESMRA